MMEDNDGGKGGKDCLCRRKVQVENKKERNVRQEEGNTVELL